MQLFSADATIVFLEELKKKIDHQNTKKPPLKIAHNRPPTFFLCTGLAPQTTQK